MKMMKITDAFETENVKTMVPLTSLFDPDSRSELLQDCLEKYFNRISTIRVLIGRMEYYGAGTTRQTILLARRFNIPTSTRVESSNLVITRGILPIYLDLCAEVGVNRIQFRKETLLADIKPREVLAFADERNMDVQFEIENLSSKNGNNEAVKAITDNAMEWLDSGAMNLVADVTGRPNHNKSHVSDEIVDLTDAELLASTFGLHTVMFRAQRANEQQILFSYFGEETHICDISLVDLPQVERLRYNYSSFTSFTEKPRLAFPIDRRRSDEQSAVNEGFE